MRCRIHGYNHHENCKYCCNSILWVNDNYKTTKEDKKLKWRKNQKSKSWTKMPTIIIDRYDLEKGMYDKIILEQIKALAKIVSEDKLSPLDLIIIIMKSYE